MNWRVVLLAMPLLASSGCAGSLLESRTEAPVVYRLEGVAAQDRGERLPLALAVTRPGGAAALDTDRIAVDQPGRVFDYYAGIRWSEPAPQMLQQQLVRALVADGRFEAVVATPSRVPSDLLLDVELRRFEAIYSTGVDAPEIRVEMQVSLVEPRAAHRVASFVAAGSAIATDNRRPAVIASFERASAEAVRAAVDQVREAAATASR